MKFLAALAAGIAAGAVVALTLVYFNPFVARASLSPLAVSGQQQFTLNYSAVPKHAIAYTNDGESRVAPYPEKILQLWEPPIRQTDVLVTRLLDANKNPAGIGIKFSSKSEGTRVLNGEALADSIWHVYLPGEGTLLVAQTENYWRYLRDIVVPAHWNSGNGWKGTWHGTITSGPGALGTARVHGGSGRFRGVEAEAVETLTAKAYSSTEGPVAMEGQLLVEMPDPDDGMTARTPESPGR